LSYGNAHARVEFPVGAGLLEPSGVSAYGF
jgi:hypothetical protein